MKHRFRSQMIQCGLFAPNMFGRCDFLQLQTILQLNACCQKSEAIYSDFWRFYGWGCHGPRPMEMESKRNRFRSRKSGVGINIFWLNGIGIGIDSTWPCAAGIRIGISSSFSERNRNRFRSAGIKHKSGGFSYTLYSIYRPRTSNESGNESHSWIQKQRNLKKRKDMTDDLETTNDLTSLTLTRTWGGGGVRCHPPGGFLSWTSHRLRWRADFLHTCISNFSPDCLKMLSLCDLWLLRYGLVLEVMSGRIFAKFEIAPKTQLWPEHFETCSVQYEEELHKSYISDFSYRWPQVRSISWPTHCKSMRKKSSRYLKYLSDLFKSLTMIMNKVRDDIFGAIWY